ncbi:MAG: ZTL protein [Alphaproteobacteria bacterium]|nr:ZTL protein [Alphaproteobacteria bacterium]
MPRIYVLAGTNGAGKSSIGGAVFRARGADYFNPDEVTRRILAAGHASTLSEANSLAWHEGRRLLERAIRERKTHAFETTLGGRTITSLLLLAATRGIAVRVWYAGLESPELHLQRVRARVARGGHNIPESKIRGRFDASRENLVKLIPTLDALRVFDNSQEADPKTGQAPQPRLLLWMERGSIIAPDRSALADTPPWAKPIVAAGLKRHLQGPHPHS